LKKTGSLKENEGTVSSLARRETLASRSASAVYQSSAMMTKPSSTFGKKPTYNYADTIPMPKVLYIRNEEQANEMVASLNGQVLPSGLVFML
jgi:hypothetical protein